MHQAYIAYYMWPSAATCGLELLLMHEVYLAYITTSPTTSPTSMKMLTLVSASVARVRTLSVSLYIFVCVSACVNGHARLESSKVK